MRLTDIDIYSELLRERTGQVIEQDDSYMLDSRLNRIARKWKYPNLAAMTIAVQGVPEEDLISDIVDIMANTETCFFRDFSPFDALRNTIAPALLDKRKKNGGGKGLNIWCAGVAGGQEAYSVALTLESLPRPLFKSTPYRIEATDMSSGAVAQAREGLYSQYEVQLGLSAAQILKYFSREGENWRIDKKIRKKINATRHNLLESSTHLGVYDVIFCRNVLTGLSPEAQHIVIERLCAHLAPDGYLVLGLNETPEVGGLPVADLRPLPDMRGIYTR